jgi:hypothetical protein
MINIFRIIEAYFEELIVAGMIIYALETFYS